MTKLCLFGVLALAVLSGCAETALIQTSPPGAKLYVNKKFVGITPVEFTVKRSDWPETKPEFRYRIEHEKYSPQEGVLATGVNWRRIMTAVFTSGINLIFKRVNAFKSDVYDFDMNPESVTANANAMPASGSIDERLRKVQDLYDQGLITEPEHRRYRSDILRELAPAPAKKTIP